MFNRGLRTVPGTVLCRTGAYALYRGTVRVCTGYGALPYGGLRTVPGTVLCRTGRVWAQHVYKRVLHGGNGEPDQAGPSWTSTIAPFSLYYIVYGIIGDTEKEEQSSSSGSLKKHRSSLGCGCEFFFMPGLLDCPSFFLSLSSLTYAGTVSGTFFPVSYYVRVIVQSV